MYSKIAILIAVLIHTSHQSISGSSSKCGPNSDPIACGRASVLRGQSHIGIPAACFNRVDAGPCAQDLIRIFYDSKTYTCKAFSYSGCGGNANRFVSVKNCYKLCHPYYRQRFISLGAPDAGAGGQSQTPLPDFSPKAEETTTAETGAEAGAEAGGGADLEMSTTTLDPNDPNGRVMFYKNKDDPNSAEKPEIQVIHEYDSFVPPGGQMGGQPGGALAQPHPMAGAGGGQRSQHGVLRNIQHQNYEPQGGYVPSSAGYKPQAVNRPEVFYTNYGKK